MEESKLKINEFSNNIFVSQFYYFLFNGVYATNILRDYIEIEEEGIFKLNILKAYPKDSSSIIFDLNERLIKIKNYFIENAHFKRKCSEDDLINFWRQYCVNQKILRVEGIRLYELSKLFDITEHLKNGYFLQDVFCGYQSETQYEYKSDCIDILQSAIYFYYEAYDYEIGNKNVLDYSQIDVNTLRPHEFKRIFTANEVAYKNYREAYINLLFFIESFINSIGYNAILEANSYTEQEKNKLQGFNIKLNNNGTTSKCLVLK